MNQDPKNTREFKEFKESKGKIDTGLSEPPWQKTLEKLERQGKITKPPSQKIAVEELEESENTSLEQITTELAREFPESKVGESIAKIKTEIPLDYVYIYNSLKKLREEPELLDEIKNNRTKIIENTEKLYNESILIKNYFDELERKQTTFLDRAGELANALGLKGLEKRLTETDTRKSINKYDKLELYLISNLIGKLNEYREIAKKSIIKYFSGSGGKQKTRIKFGEIYQEIKASEILKENNEKEIYLVELTDRKIITGFKEGKFQVLPEENKDKYVIKTYKPNSENSSKESNPDESILELQTTLIEPEQNKVSETVLFTAKDLETTSSEENLELKVIDKNTLRGVINQTAMSEKILGIKPKIHYLETLKNGEIVVIQEYVEENSLEDFLRTTKELSLRDYLTIMKSTLEFYQRVKDFVHRDFKPDNAFINSETKVVSPTDFDIAIDIPRFLVDKKYQTDTCRYFEGTIGFAAPELLNLKTTIKGKTEEESRELLRKIDNYIVGSVFTKILSGKLAISDMNTANERIIALEKQYRLAIKKDGKAGEVKRTIKNGKTIHTIHKPEGINISLQERTINTIINESLNQLATEKEQTTIQTYLASKKIITKNSEEKPKEKKIKNALKKMIANYDLKTKVIAETVYNTKKLLSEKGVINQDQIKEKTIEEMKRYEKGFVYKKNEILSLIEETTKAITNIYKPVLETQLMLYATLMSDPEQRFNNEESLSRINRIFEKYDQPDKNSLLNKIIIPSASYRPTKVDKE